MYQKLLWKFFCLKSYDLNKKQKKRKITITLRQEKLPHLSKNQCSEFQLFLEYYYSINKTNCLHKFQWIREYFQVGLMKIGVEKFKNRIRLAKGDDSVIGLCNRSFRRLPIRMKPGFHTLFRVLGGTNTPPELPTSAKFSQPVIILNVLHSFCVKLEIVSYICDFEYQTK